MHHLSNAYSCWLCQQSVQAASIALFLPQSIFTDWGCVHEPSMLFIEERNERQGGPAECTGMVLMCEELHGRYRWVFLSYLLLPINNSQVNSVHFIFFIFGYYSQLS